MKVLVDNSNDDVVFIAPVIMYTGITTTTLDEYGNVILILGDMTPDNSRIETVTEAPDDFIGRNYTYSDGEFIKKTKAE